LAAELVKNAVIHLRGRLVVPAPVGHSNQPTVLYLDLTNAGDWCTGEQRRVTQPSYFLVQRGVEVVLTVHDEDRPPVPRPVGEPTTRIEEVTVVGLAKVAFAVNEQAVLLALCLVRLAVR
jgi:hypothetical protein